MAKDKDKLCHHCRETSGSFSETRRRHNMGSVRTLDSCNVTQMRWMLTGIRHEDRPWSVSNAIGQDIWPEIVENDWMSEEWHMIRWQSTSKKWRCCKGLRRTHEEEGFFQCGLVKAFPLKLQNKFERLEIDDNDTDIVDTGCTTPMNGVSPTEHSTDKTCLIPHQINYIVTICYVKRFISKLKKHISWLKPKHYFVWTVQPQSKLMINVGLRTMDTHCIVDMKALLDMLGQPLNYLLKA